ncbi:MAG: serine/threonine protein kinase [Sandaracinaceae bacterium]|nr:serine/threonine protein kinase [Myxococcales bacterium]MCB9657901.1 serine/threonine protein kinase [Sandaracinaceae bacterium]
MGVVYRATERYTGREVAVKILHRKFLPGSVERVRFLREAQALATVSHPNIVKVFDMGFDAVGHPFVVMELLDGQTLAELIADGTVDESLAVAITIGLLGALTAVHAAGIVHRDIKPGNIIVGTVGGERMVKLVDFGLSRRFGEDDRLTASGVALGTPPYMSPEQIMGEQVGPSSDVYSVGCTLFELLAGRPPYDLRDSRSVAALFRRIIDEPPPIIDELRPDVLPEVSRIVSRALHRDRSVRYSDCQSMRRALVEAIGEHRGSGIPARLSLTPEAVTQRTGEAGDAS